MGGIPHPPSQLLLCLPHSLPGRRLAWMSQLCSVFCALFTFVVRVLLPDFFFGDAFDCSHEGLSVNFLCFPPISVFYHFNIKLLFGFKIGYHAQVPWQGWPLMRCVHVIPGQGPPSHLHQVPGASMF